MYVMQVESSNLSSHVLERLDKHFDVVCTKIAAVERTLGAQRSRAERGVTDRLADVEANVRRLDEAVRGSVLGRLSDTAASAPAPAAAAAAAAASDGGDVQSILVSTSEKMTIYEGVITVLNREVEKLSTQVTSPTFNILTARLAQITD